MLVDKKIRKKYGAKVILEKILERLLGLKRILRKFQKNSWYFKEVVDRNPEKLMN